MNYFSCFFCFKKYYNGISKHILVYVNSCEAANIIKQQLNYYWIIIYLILIKKNYTIMIYIVIMD